LCVSSSHAFPHLLPVDTSGDKIERRKWLIQEAVTTIPPVVVPVPAQELLYPMRR
jgi:hypothetical protein